MKSWKNVAIVGVGLLGGSIGLGLIARRLADRVIGVGRDATRLRRAQTLGAITEFTTDLESLSEGPEMVVICTPVATIVPHVLAFAHRARDRMIITDVGSTKAQILHDVARAWPGGPARFVGSHPLAGSDKTGAEHAHHDLLERRTVIVTPPPTELAGPSDVASDDAVAEVTTFWRQLGATVHAMPAEAHDVAMAWTSHLPHIMASALAASTPAAYLPWVATGWRDTTRIAGGDTTLWNQIVATNRDNLRVAVATLRDRLDTLHTALRDDLPATWELLLREGKERRDSVAD